MTKLEEVAAAVRVAILEVADIDVLEHGSEKVARTAIKAMREPTDAMRAGYYLPSDVEANCRGICDAAYTGYVNGALAEVPA